MKNFFKKNSVFKVICLTILVVCLLTWILITKEFNGAAELVKGERAQVGLSTFLNYLTAVPQNFGYVPIYLIVVGGFYGVLYKTNGYRNLLEKTAEKYSGSEWIYLVIEMIIVSVIASVTGFDLGLVVLFPLIFAQLLLMGYSKITAVMATVGSVAVGIFASTYSYAENIQIAYETLTLTPHNNIFAKIILFILALGLLILNVLLYAKKHKISSPRKGYIYPETNDKKAKSWPVTLTLVITFVVIVLASIPWAGTFNINLFNDIFEKINTYEIAKFPIINKLFGSLTAWGQWSYTNVTVFLLVMSAVVAILGKVKFDDFVEGFAAGAQKALRPAICTIFALSLVYIAFYHGILYTIIGPILGITKEFNVITMSIASMIIHFMYVVPNYAAYYVLGYPVALFTNAKVYGVMQIVFQAAYGLTVLFVPTSLVLVSTLSYSKVSYGKWFKAIWKLLLELFVLLIVFGLILLAI